MGTGTTGLEPGQVTIRPARADDAAGMALVHVTAWQEAYRGLLPADYLTSLTVPGAEQRWLAILSADRGHSRFLVAQHDTGSIVAIASVGVARERDLPAGVGELQMINVDPRWWAVGVGTALLARAEDELRAMACTGAYLWVLEGNGRAERFYRRCGWQETDIRRNDRRIAGSPREIRYVRRL
jgi:RimJ/RimL family protein N-acetyltransferase